MTKYLGTIEHNARCFSCLRPDHVDVYDEHVARVDYDALDQQLAEAMDKIRTQGEQYMEMYQLNSDARTRLADVSGMLVEAWTLMVDGKVADDFGDRLQQWIDTRQPSEKRVTTRATDSASGGAE